MEAHQHVSYRLFSIPAALPSIGTTQSEVKDKVGYTIIIHRGLEHINGHVNMFFLTPAVSGQPCDDTLSICLRYKPTLANKLPYLSPDTCVGLVESCQHKGVAKHCRTSQNPLRSFHDYVLHTLRQPA